MNPVSHHIPDELLFEYAVGAAGEALALAVACHASLCADCRRAIGEFTSIAGSVLDAMSPGELSADALPRLQRRIEETPAFTGVGEVAVVAPAGKELRSLPRPLWSYLAEGRDDFASLVPGVAGIDLGIAPTGGAAWLFRFDPGVVIPRHDHAALECGVVLTGSLLEDGRAWRRGDVAYKDPGEAHEQIVGPGEPCVALVVNEGALIPLTPEGELLRLLTA